MCGADERVKVLNTWRSMYGLRVLIALKERGVQFEYQEEDLSNKSKLLLDSNPVYKKVPVLIHNGKPICESLIIVQYIDETWPSQEGKGFLPKDPYQRAMVRFWADYVDKKVYDAGAGIFQNIEGDLMEQGKRDLSECMVVLDGVLRDVFGGGAYFGGQHLGLVDIALARYICWFEGLESIANFKLLEDSKCPHLCAWFKAIGHNPSVKEAFSIASPLKVMEYINMSRKGLQA